MRIRFLKAMLMVVVLMLSALPSVADPADGTMRLDRFGGLLGKAFGASPAFRIHQEGARSWLVTPEGNAFLSLGVCVVNPQGDTEKGSGVRPYAERVLSRYGNVEGWAAATRSRFQDWGLNTLGNWSGAELRKEIPYTVELGMNPGGWGLNSVPDFFDPVSQDYIRERAGAAAAYVNDPYLVGYYLDNELPWAKDWRAFPDLFPGYVAMGPEAPGKQRLVEFMRARYDSFAGFAGVWKSEATGWDELAAVRVLHPRDTSRALVDMEAFVYLAARAYFQTAFEAVRSHDPHHLILGCRFIWALAPRPVVRACGEFTDVVSVNYYEAGPLGEVALKIDNATSMRVEADPMLRVFHTITGKPVMVTEFSIRAMESNNSNAYPPGFLLQPVVKTQAERADKFSYYVRAWMAQPFFVGYHWFQWMDQPAAGRAGDGENGNYGLVTLDDSPWETLTDRMRKVNREVWTLHAGAGGQP